MKAKPIERIAKDHRHHTKKQATKPPYKIFDVEN